jgi:hypothetical protein
MPEQRECERCGRKGVQGFVAYADGSGRWACSAGGACDKRIREERARHGLYRWESGNNHYYKLDGERVPGVTTLLKEGLPKPALLGWGIRTVARFAAQHVDELWAMRGMGEEATFQALRNRPFEERNDAGVRGTTLHRYAEKLSRGEPVDVPAPLQPWVQSVVDYLDDYQPRSVLQETTVGSRRWRYCGTLDDVSDFPDGRRRVVDFKSGKGVYSEDGLQLAAYRNAELYKAADGEDRPLEELGLCDEGYIVHIRPEGYEVVPFYIGPEAHQAFLRVAWVARELRGDEGLLAQWQGQPLPRPERSMTA